MTARAERQAGFTIIEVVVAALVLTMGALATFGMLSAATKNTYRAKQTQVALDMAQQELEALRGLNSEEVALYHHARTQHQHHRARTTGSAATPSRCSGRLCPNIGPWSSTAENSTEGPAKKG